jgi:hypothetical protein
MIRSIYIISSEIASFNEKKTIAPVIFVYYISKEKSLSGGRNQASEVFLCSAIRAALKSN